MGNRVHIIATKFEDYTGTGFGFRMTDDHASTYNNSFEHPMETDTKGFLREIVEYGNNSSNDLLETAKEVGAYINGVFFTGEAITKILDEIEVES